MNRLVTIVLLAWLAVLVTGCAVDRGPAGEVVLGWDAGQLTDTANAAGAQAVQTLGTFLGLPTELSVALGGVVGAGGLGVLMKRLGQLRGREEGWDERERAASVQHPMAQVVYEQRVPIAEPGGVIDDRGEIESSRGRGYGFNQNGGAA